MWRVADRTVPYQVFLYEFLRTKPGFLLLYEYGFFPSDVA